MKTAYILPLINVRKEDVLNIGQEAATLGEIAHTGCTIPDGFVITKQAFSHFLKENNLATKIKHILSLMHVQEPETLLSAAEQIKNLIVKSDIDEAFLSDLFTAYKTLGGVLNEPEVHVNAMSLGFNQAEAYTLERFTNVRGHARFVIKVKEAWASVFHPSALFAYKNENVFQTEVAVLVQKTLHPEITGRIVTSHPVSKDKTKIVIEVTNGTTDEYEVTKNELLITKKIIGMQDNEKGKALLSDKDILFLAALGKKLEKHFYFPQDITWGKQGGTFFVTDAKTLSFQHTIPQDTISQSQTKYAAGTPVSAGIAKGPLHFINSVADLEKYHTGDIIYLKKFYESHLSKLKRAKAVITNYPGLLSKTAFFLRAQGIPGVMDVKQLTAAAGQIIIVNGTKGEITTPLQPHLPLPSKTATKIYSYLREETYDSSAVEGAFLSGDECMKKIGVHPKKFIHDGKQHEFIQLLTEHIAEYAHAFNPNPFIYQTANLRTDELRSLRHGSIYEPLEKNPLVGYRGAYRYVHDADVFALELTALKQLKNKKNCKNICLSIPFIRSIQEFAEVKKIISAHGLHRSPTFKLYATISLPGNSIAGFAKLGIDGIVLDADTLTSLILGTDRENDEIAPAYNELDESVLNSIEQFIISAQQHHLPVLIIGHAITRHAHLVEKFVQRGTTAFIVPPSAVAATHATVSAQERRILS